MKVVYTDNDISDRLKMSNEALADVSTLSVLCSRVAIVIAILNQQVSSGNTN